MRQQPAAAPVQNRSATSPPRRVRRNNAHSRTTPPAGKDANAAVLSAFYQQRGVARNRLFSFAEGAVVRAGGEGEESVPTINNLQ